MRTGHLQATGRDARGRKQYRYHPRWRAVRDESKYHRMLVFGRVLPKVRAQVEHDLGLPGLPRRRVLAAVVKLLEKTLARVGNEEYARDNNSFGLTTLRTNHSRVEGSRIKFDFRGKHGIDHHLTLQDRRLANIIKRCQDLHGQHLFEFVDHDGHPHAIGSDDVNGYLHEISGEEITAKDFRTWAATNLAALALRELERYDSEAKNKKERSPGGGGGGGHVGQHAERVPQVLYPPGDLRRLPGWQPTRGAEAAGRRGAGPCRAWVDGGGGGGDGLPQHAARPGGGVAQVGREAEIRGTLLRGWP